MNPAKCCLIVLATLFGRLSAQTEAGPVLATQPRIQYPPIARAAHVEGDVVVRFSIDSDGRTTSVHTLSGPPMFQPLVEGQIKAWRFRVPLPPNAQSDFEAVYKFRLRPAEDSLDDDLDAPQYYPCCGDLIILPLGAMAVTGEVRSLDGSQKIDVTPAAAMPSEDRCPADKEQQVPAGSDADDFVELFRACGKGCLDYKVRVYRDGRVEWHGRDQVVTKGEGRGQISAKAASALVSKFQAQSFWSACSTMPPSLSEDRGVVEFKSGDYLTAKIGDHVKSVEANSSFAVEAGLGKRFEWAVDKTANTHDWIHGDAVVEPFENMSRDISMPKPGMTALIRSTFHFSLSTGQQTQEALKRLLASNVDVDAADESGWTALMYAAELNSDNRPVDLLLEAHANANRASLHGDTALMMAAYGGRLSESLLKAGADINARNADGVTTLMLLAQHIDPDELHDAIVAGADSAGQDREGRTALDYLRAASCQKAIVPLPEPEARIVTGEPPHCPSNSEEYRKSEALLKAAMKKKPR
jgi:TonB family protein